MVARSTAQKSESGQSLIEFMFMLPLMLGLTVLLVRITTAIQVSIVNQKYSRMQVHALARNSPYYPSQRIRNGLLDSGTNRLTVGVSDDSTSGSGFVRPKATEILVARSRALASGGSQDSGSVTSRADVRVRSTVTLCSSTHALSANTINQSHNLVGADANPWGGICRGTPQ